MGRAVFQDERSFKKAWESGMPALEPGSVRSTNGREMFYDAARAVGCAMSDLGFRMFSNGGLPLVLRDVDAMRQEIVLYPGPTTVAGTYEPLTVKVHVSHAGIKAVRERYWIGGGRAPSAFASGYLALVQEPPSWILWDVADSRETADELAAWVLDLARPWFDHFDSLETLIGDVLVSNVPLVSTADVLELVLAEKGRERARRFLREIIEFGATLSSRDAPLKRVDERDPVTARLDAIATSYRLR